MLTCTDRRLSAGNVQGGAATGPHEDEGILVGAESDGTVVSAPLPDSGFSGKSRPVAGAGSWPDCRVIATLADHRLCSQTHHAAAGDA